MVVEVLRNNQEVVDAWLEHWGPYGCNSRRSLYYDCSTIFSYGPHFPIARFVRANNGEEVVLFTTANYSHTTAAHKGLVLRALYHSAYRVFVVPFGDDRHAENHDHLIDEGLRFWDLARSARSSWSINHATVCATGAHRAAAVYAEFFGLDEPTLSPPPDLSEILERADRLGL